MTALRLMLTVFAALSWTLIAPPTFADPPAEKGFGPRVGFGLDPDQVVAGVQALLGGPVGIFRFAPSADVGLGDDVTTFAFNADLIAAVALPSSRSSLYAGAGPSVVAWEPDGGQGDLEIGATLLAGFRFPFAGNHLYNVESRFGISDVPEFRLLIGFLFGSAPSLEPAPEQ